MTATSAAKAGVEPPPIAVPVIVGVTGHRDLPGGEIAALRLQLHDMLGTLRHLFPSLQMACALAQGADQLAAQVAIELGIPLLAILPMPFAAYRLTLPGAAQPELDRLWHLATLTLELPWVAGEPSAKNQYEQLGLLLARRSHILLAIWDGLEDAQEEAFRGGTAHVVSVRQTGSQQGAVFSNSRLFPESPSRLDLAPGGPILHLPASRGGPDGVARPPAVARPRLWRDDFAPGTKPHWQTPHDLSARNFPSLLGILALNADIAATAPVQVRRHLRHLSPPGAPDPALGAAKAAMAWLRQIQVGIDLAAQAKQMRLVGPRPTGPGLRRRIFRRPGAHLVFALVVPLAVLSFELYSNIDRNLGFLAGYLGILALALAYDNLHVKRHSWQAKFQDYRAMAEAMRVQLFWALSSVPEAVPDSYLRKQRDELGWIRDALQGPALWAACVALAVDRPARALVEAGWLEDQKRFFVGNGGGGKAAENKRRFTRYQNALFIFVASGVLAGLVVFFLQVFQLKNPELINGLITLVGFLPAVGAYCSIYAERLAFEQQAQAYAGMGRVFTRALTEARQIEPGAECDDAFRSLMKEVGREALDENAEWLKEHRKRPIQFSTGV